jgi:hypothetical protein
MTAYLKSLSLHSLQIAPFKNTTKAGCISLFEFGRESSKTLKTGESLQSDNISPENPPSFQN